MGGTSTISTLGDLVRVGYRLWAHCGRRECGHRADLDLEALVERLGPQHSYLAPDLVPRLRCGTCGGREIGLSLLADKGYRDGASTRVGRGLND